MKKIKNANDLAKAVCKIEGGKVNLPIAQVKEVLRIVGDLMMHEYFLITTALDNKEACRHLILDLRHHPSVIKILRGTAARRYLAHTKKKKAAKRARR